MAANAGIHRAVVHAGATANALQRGTQLFVGVGLGAAVVQQDQVHFFRAVQLARLAWPADQVEIGGHRLPGGRTRQQAVERGHMFELLHHLFNAGDRNVNLGHRGAHAPIAFVLHQAQGAGFGDAKVHTREANVGVGKLAAQHTTADLDEGIHVFGVGHAGYFFGKEFGNLCLCLVDGRHDDVRRLLTRQLHDVFAHIGLESFNTRRFHGMVELDLFTHHRLALDDVAGVDALGNGQGNGVGLIGRFCPVHVDTVGRELLLQLFQQAGQVRQAVAADGRTQVAQAFALFLVGELAFALGLQKVHGTAKVLALPRVVEYGAAALLEVVHGVDWDDLAHCDAPVGWRNSTINSLGPCAP